MPTHYEALGVHSTSEQEVIEAAYKALMRKYHPDRAGDNDRVRQITAAYETLRSPLKRRAYDATLKLFPSRDVVKREARDQRQQQSAREKPKRSASLDGQEGNSSKRCPDCGEKIAGAAQVCRYCGYRFHGRGETTLGQRIGCVLIILLFGLIAILAGESAEWSGQVNEIGTIEAGSCDAGSVELGLGDVASKGTLQLLAPKPDTDAHNELVIGLSSGSCINRFELDELVAASGETGPVTLLVGYDPKGTLYNYRNRFD